MFSNSVSFICDYISHLTQFWAMHISSVLPKWVLMFPRTGLGSNCCCCLAAKSYLTLYNPMDSSLPGSFAHGVSQARILEWVAISSSRGSSWLRAWTRVSCIGRSIFYGWVIREAIIQNIHHQFGVPCRIFFFLDQGFCLIFIFIYSFGCERS